MPKPSRLDPTASIGAFFGAELRRYRLAAGLSQDGLGALINYTGAFIGLVENAKRTPPHTLADAADRVLDARGALANLWTLVSSESHPQWFRPYLELEAEAVLIRVFDLRVVPGLLQTPDYARAVMRAGRTVATEAEIEQAAEARMDRQKILSTPGGPILRVVLDEAVLHRPIGGSDIARGQFERLLAPRRNVVVQVLPFMAGAHAGLDGPLTLLQFTDQVPVGYADGRSHGRLIDDPDEVRQASAAFDAILGEALSPEISADLIRAAMEEI
jgi:transcriptional regulator with XRE-family HTH domain